MKLRKLRRNWDRLGRDDPMWAILSDSSKRGNEWNAEEFFASGVQEIDSVLRNAESYRPSLQRKTALDFGCGIGRLTVALAQHFDEVHGVDVAPSMIARAKELVPSDRCHFHVNEADDLTLFADESFNFIYSRITIQHIPPTLAKRYIAELVRVLAPDGVMMMQVPSTLIASLPAWRRMVPDRIWDAWYDVKSEFSEVARCRLFGVPVDTVVALLQSGGGTVLSILPESSAGPAWHSYLYVVSKHLCSDPTLESRSAASSTGHTRTRTPQPIRLPQ